MNPETVLQERYPLADFSVYFRHLSACQTVKGLNTHEHHICPRKQFPEYAEGFPENLITLHTDDHAFAHALLEAACGIKSPHTTFIEASTALQCKAYGLKGAQVLIARGSTAWKSGIRAMNGALTIEQRRENGRKGGGIAGKLRTEKQVEQMRVLAASGAGGRIAGPLFKENRLGIFSPEHRGKNTHTRWHVNRAIVKAGCALCQQS